MVCSLLLLKKNRIAMHHDICSDVYMLVSSLFRRPASLLFEL